MRQLCAFRGSNPGRNSRSTEAALVRRGVARAEPRDLRAVGSMHDSDALAAAGSHGRLSPSLDGAATGGLVRQAHGDMLIVAEAVPDLLARMRACEAPVAARWTGAGER